MRWVYLGLWVVACLAIGGFGGRWTAPEIPGWYRGLIKPSFNPPSWIFGPVWTTLYILMAIAAWLVAQAPDSPSRRIGLALFLFQLALNLAWSWIFFHKHAIGPAALEVAVLWCAIANPPTQSPAMRQSPSGCKASSTPARKSSWAD